MSWRGLVLWPRHAARRRGAALRVPGGGAPAGPARETAVADRSRPPTRVETTGRGPTPRPDVTGLERSVTSLPRAIRDDRRLACQSDAPRLRIASSRTAGRDAARSFSAPHQPVRRAAFRRVSLADVPRRSCWRERFLLLPEPARNPPDEHSLRRVCPCAAVTLADEPTDGRGPVDGGWRHCGRRVDTRGPHPGQQPAGGVHDARAVVLSCGSRRHAVIVAAAL